MSDWMTPEDEAWWAGAHGRPAYADYSTAQRQAWKAGRRQLHEKEKRDAARALQERRCAGYEPRH